MDEAGFWDALGNDRRQTEESNVSPDLDITSDVKDIVGESSAKERAKQRRESLLSMLHATEERFKRIKTRRSTTIAIGVDVVIKSGPYEGQQTKVQDADYISSRVLVQITNSPEPQWLPFADVAVART